MTADPTTLSLADLAAAVVRLGAHRDWYCREDLDLLLAAANRLPAVVARVEALEELVTAWQAWNSPTGDTGANEARLNRAEASLAALETP